MIEKIKSLSKDTLIYGVSTTVSRFFTFLLVPFYTNVFLPSEYGIVTNVFAYIAMLNVFFSIGLESGFFKFSSTLEVGTKKQNFSTPFLLVGLNSLLLSCIIFFLAENLTSVFLIAESEAKVIRIAAGILLFDAISLIPFAYLRLNRQPKKFALLKIINVAINFSLNVILILHFEFGVEAVFISNLVASAVTFLLMLPIVVENFEISFNRGLVKELLYFSIPYIPAGIAANVIQVINRPLIVIYSGEDTLGIFQANYKLGIFMMLFVSVFEFAWRPFFLNHAKEPDAKELFSKVLTVFVTAASLLFLVVAFFVPDLVRMELPFKGHIIGEKYWAGLSIVPVILFGYILYGIYINFMAGIYIEKKTRYLPLITGAAAVANIVSNIVLIPVAGMTGAAFATLISYMTMMLLIYVVVRKYYYVKYEFGKVFLILSGMLIVFMPSYFIDLSGGLNTIFKILLLVVFVVFLKVFGFLNRGTIGQLKN